MSASNLQESSEVRIEHSLHKNEEEFRVGRRNIIQQCLQNHEMHCSENKVPNIALLGSGGGQKAMVGLLGSLVQLDKAGLLDSILYLSGVSGSTWCMASLYEEPNWSTKLETVKDKIVKRLDGPAVSWTDAFAKLKKYYYGKDNFSLTDFWAVVVVATIVKEINEHTLAEQWNQKSKDPYPIYTVIDKISKQKKEGEPWFEFTPHEAGYSLTGAFVGVSNFGSQFEKGSKMKKQPEIDMLYLQGLCGSALADGEETRKLIWEQMKGAAAFVQKNQFCQKLTIKSLSNKQPENDMLYLQALFRSALAEEEEILERIWEKIKECFHCSRSDSKKCFQVFLDLADMNLFVLDGKDHSALDESIRSTLTDLAGDECQLNFPEQKLDVTDKEAAKLHMKHYNMNVCNGLCVSDQFSSWPFDVCISIIKCMALWIWGRKYNFLHNMTAEAEEVPAAVLESEERDYEDAGLLLNSPYFSVLRKERNIDLIISLDFSDGDPFMTVREAAKKCRELKIPFPDVNIPSEDSRKPKDFYVFKGKDVPTVIHIPLFNVVNCGDQIEDWRKRYQTFQSSAYSAEMINDLMEVAGKNISNNKAKLVKEIREIVGLQV